MFPVWPSTWLKLGFGTCQAAPALVFGVLDDHILGSIITTNPFLNSLEKIVLKNTDTLEYFCTLSLGFALVSCLLYKVGITQLWDVDVGL